MKYAIFSFDGYGLSIAQRLQEEGHEVHVGIVSHQVQVCSELEANIPPEDQEIRSRRLSMFEGLLNISEASDLVEKVKRRPSSWFIFHDLNHLFRIANDLREVGCPGNYPEEEDFLLEIDREKAKDFVIEHYPNVKVAQKKRFSKGSQAKKFLSSNEDLWVLKGLAEEARTVLPDVDDSDLAHGQVLDALSQHPEEYESAGFILELLIPNAVELTPQKIYLDGRPIATCMCIENKPIGSGNVGPMTDCAQDLIFETAVDDSINKIAFPDIVDRMAETKQGLFFWDASILANPRTGALYFGEFCANRPGYNSLYTEMALCGSASKYFEMLASGKSPYSAGAVASSCRIFNLHNGEGGYARSGGSIEYKGKAAEGLWLRDARKSGRRIVTAGLTNTVAVMTACGQSVADSAKKLYCRIDEFSFEGAYYRPHFDFVSREYRSSIVNRLNYGLQRTFYKIAFGLD